jgi:hypothetical protein
VAIGKKAYKLRLTTKVYKLSYDYINYTINLVGRSFGKWCCSGNDRMAVNCDLDNVKK